jgi:plasmid stability protein
MLSLLALQAISCYSPQMATITIRNLDETVKRKLQVRAALKGRSMEAEIREALSELAGKTTEIPEFQDTSSEFGLGTAIHNLFAPLGGADDLQIPPRTKSHRPIPTFDK